MGSVAVSGNARLFVEAGSAAGQNQKNKHGTRLTGAVEKTTLLTIFSNA